MELIGHEIAFPRTLQGFHGAILGAGRNKESLAHFVNGLVMMAVRDPFRTAEKRSQPALRIDFIWYALPSPGPGSGNASQRTGDLWKGPDKASRRAPH